MLQNVGIFVDLINSQVSHLNKPVLWTSAACERRWYNTWPVVNMFLGLTWIVIFNKTKITSNRINFSIPKNKSI